MVPTPSKLRPSTYGSLGNIPDPNDSRDQVGDTEVVSCKNNQGKSLLGQGCKCMVNERLSLEIQRHRRILLNVFFFVSTLKKGNSIKLPLVLILLS